MRPIWKGTISFGLVNIPIALGIATQRSDPKFRTLDSDSLQPIRQQYFSPSRDEVIDRVETVKGYEVSKDRYVVVSDEELESVAVERRRTIDILGFVDLAEVDPVYYDRTYWITPQENAEKPYVLFLEALRDTGKVAVGKLVLSSKEHLVVLRPAGEALAVELLFYPEDVRMKRRDEIAAELKGAKVTKAEKEMAVQLVESLATPFDPDAYENEHKRDVMALIERKTAGEEIVIEEGEEPAARPVPDLMTALKASLAEAQGKGAKGPAKKAPAKAKAKAAAGSNGSKKKPAARKKSASR